MLHEDQSAFMSISSSSREISVESLGYYSILLKQMQEFSTECVSGLACALLHQKSVYTIHSAM
jgi:hypothetical protein